MMSEADELTPGNDGYCDAKRRGRELSLAASSIGQIRIVRLVSFSVKSVGLPVMLEKVPSSA